MTEDRLVLVGDIGGTNARFALADPQTLEMHHTGYRRTADFPGLHEALTSYLAEEGQNSQPRRAAIAVASPVGDDIIDLTNNHWRFSVSELQEQLGLEGLYMLNDFTVQALAIPHLDAEDFTQVGPAIKGRSNAAIGVIGPGTGLGVSGLLPNGYGGWVAISGEGGHIGVAPSTEQEMEILRFAWQQFGRTSIERLICGSGLVFLYRALCHLRGRHAEAYNEAHIVKHALSGDCPICHETIMQFCAFLGCCAGDLALTLGARGGIYIAGGVVPRFGELFAASPFRARFEEKGRFSGYNAAIPTFVVAPHDNPALIGAASIFQSKEPT